KEVQDTDNDGLPEFVDAWGEPLQFYRWPIGYTSTVPGQTVDLQKGFADYTNAEPRQQDPLDSNRQLVAPVWWWGTSNVGATGDPFGTFFGPIDGAGAAGESGHAFAFQNYFHTLVDNTTFGLMPPAPPLPPPRTWWDGGGFYKRREYF